MKHYIIACGGLKPELESLRKEQNDVTVRYLKQNYHRAPDKLNIALQETLKEVPEDEDLKVVLGYGLCSNGVVGLTAPAQGLYIPRVHDCIALYLGSRETYNKEFRESPGTYYLTPAWINNRTDPLGLMEHEYTKRVGRELAEETMQDEIRNYKRISFIHTTGTDSPSYVERAQENARFFNKEFNEFERNDKYFRRILFGPYEAPDFIYIEPGEKVKQTDFLK